MNDDLLELLDRYDIAQLRGDWVDACSAANEALQTAPPQLRPYIGMLLETARARRREAENKALGILGMLGIRKAKEERT